MHKDLIYYLTLIRRDNESARQCLTRFLDQQRSRIGLINIAKYSMPSKEAKMSMANKQRFLEQWIKDLLEARKEIEEGIDKDY